MSIALILSAGSSAGAADVQTLTSTDPRLAWKRVPLPDGRSATFTHGIGSGAFRHPSDPPNVIWTVGDRGPNYDCGDAKDLLGKAVAKRCKDATRGRVFPTPDYTPSIYQLELDAKSGTFRVLSILPLKTLSGRPITGLSNPQTITTRDTALDLAGRVLPESPDALDLEAIVRLADGTFWVADEMGPSLAHIAADGRVLKRLVPATAVGDYAKADTQIVGTLPAILSRRRANRGFEALALSPDETTLYTLLQSPLASPDEATFEGAVNTRLIAIDRASGTAKAQFVYRLEEPRSFAGESKVEQKDVRLSEMVAIGAGRLLVLERTDKTTRLYEIALAGATDILGSRWDDARTAPTLEQQADPFRVGIVPVTKTLRFDTARDANAAPGKIEGIAVLADGSLALINDNDFAIRNEATSVVIVRGRVAVDPEVFRR